MSLQAILYTRGSLQLLDQRLLPHETVYLHVPDPQAAWTQIRDMVVRGAPAIGVTGALSLAVDLTTNKNEGKAFQDTAAAVKYIQETLDYLVTSRPTAVNLADAANKLKAAAQSAAAAPGATAKTVTASVVTAAEAFLEEDIAANKAMGAYGSQAMLAETAARGLGVGGGRLRVLTHCNTGSLATAGYGTALGIIRALHEQGKLAHAYCTETRPYNQGARLTAFELVHDGLPATLICDSAAASLMASGQVDAVVVGADRVVANGDTANKIGTYTLAIVAAYHNIPFFIASPTTTLDPDLPDGSHIVIEQRSPEEITHVKGKRVAAEGIQVWNPAFDVAPASLVAGIVTEKGLVPKDAATGKFAVGPFMAKLGLWSAKGQHANGGDGIADGDAKAASTTISSSGTVDGFTALTTETVKHYIVQRPSLLQLVGPAESADSWSVREVGDGNINFVYIVEGPSGGLCLKQGLPYVRCVGESWPLTQDRVRIEALALMREAEFAPAHVPHVHHYDPRNCLIAMQYLPAPFIILRRGLVQGNRYPHLAEHVATFLAQTLFNTSQYKLESGAFRQQVAQFSNNEMCRLTEQVIFMEPYTIAANNHHNSPHLDADVAALRDDVAAKLAISELKAKFVQNAEALLHGDLHTGSIMVTDTQSYMIDPEFAFCGPMAFDVAKILANLLLAYFAAFGHEATSGQPRTAQKEWLLQCVHDIWTLFANKFQQLWDAACQGATAGDLSPAALLGPAAPQGPAGLKACQAAFFQHLFQDTLSFAGSFFIRRIVGIAHVADMDSIPDAAVRAGCERRALHFGRCLLVQPHTLASIQALVEAAKAAAQP